MARTLELQVTGFEVGHAQHGYHPITLESTRGPILTRLYPVPEGTERAVITVGGVGGGWDTPARDLYPWLGTALPTEGIALCRVRFRHPTVLEEAVLDVLAAIAFLEAEGVTQVGLVGHSFGGAVVIQAAALAPQVRTVVTLATQGYGADPASELGPRCSLLLLHGTADRVLSPVCSQHAFEGAREPKEIALYEGAGHGLDEAAEAVRLRVHDWLVARLSERGGID
ncbi:Alpha/beta hydrolase family protein [compost metagenome]